MVPYEVFKEIEELKEINPKADYDRKNKRVIIGVLGKEVVLSSDWLAIFQGGKATYIAIPRPIVFKGEYPFVPVRAVGEALGAQVNWDEKEKAVEISYYTTRAKIIGSRIRQLIRDGRLPLGYEVEIDGKRYRIVSMGQQEFDNNLNLIPSKGFNEVFVYLDSDWNLVANPEVLIKLKVIERANRLMAGSRLYKFMENDLRILNDHERLIAEWKVRAFAAEQLQEVSAMLISGAAKAAAQGTKIAVRQVWGHIKKETLDNMKEELTDIANYVNLAIFGALRINRGFAEYCKRVEASKQYLASYDEAVEYYKAFVFTQQAAPIMQLHRYVAGIDLEKTTFDIVQDYVSGVFEKLTFGLVKGRGSLGEALGKIDKTEKQKILANIGLHLHKEGDKEVSLMGILEALSFIKEFRDCMNSVESNIASANIGLSPGLNEIYNFRLLNQSVLGNSGASSGGGSGGAAW